MGVSGGSTAVAAGAVAALLMCAAVGAFALHGEKGRDSMNRASGVAGAAGVGGAAIPEIDRQVPEKVETAIFALG